MKLRSRKLEGKFRIWKALVDSSYYFAIGGLKAQGFEGKEAKRRLRERWMRALREHRDVNREIARRLSGQRG